MRIRQMEIADYSAVHGLWRTCALSEEPEDSLAEVGYLLASSQGTGFVAEEQGAIVGAVLCGSDGRYGYIHHLAVAPTHRYQGIGRALVQACVHFVHRKQILIMVRADNPTGKAFWQQLNFQEVDWVRVQCLQGAG